MTIHLKGFSIGFGYHLARDPSLSMTKDEKIISNIGKVMSYIPIANLFAAVVFGITAHLYRECPPAMAACIARCVLAITAPPLLLVIDIVATIAIQSILHQQRSRLDRSFV